VNSALFQVGNRGDNHSLSTFGHMDDFGLWDVALSSEQIQRIYYWGHTHGDDLQTAVNKAIAATLSVTDLGSGVQIGWTPGGGTLESSPVLGPAAVWTPVGTANPLQLPINDTNRFFRVVMP
jgi:hypothetical protein